MELYFNINLCATLFSLVALLTLQHAPARLRFYIVLMSMFCWLIPWPYLYELRLAPAIQQSADFIPYIPLPSFDIASVTRHHSFVWNSLLDWWWLAVLAIGSTLMLVDIVQYCRLYRQWHKRSHNDNKLWQLLDKTDVPVTVRRLSAPISGMLTGLPKPIIWIDDALQDKDLLKCTLLHEFTHWQQKDHLWLWVITLLQRLFWWNPLIWLMARYARQQIELSCDEHCRHQMPQHHYQQQLIQLILSQHSHSLPNQAVLGMSSKQKFSLKRVNHLNKEIKMKKRYLFAPIAMILMTSWMGISNATSVDSPTLTNKSLNSLFKQAYQSTSDGNGATAITFLQEIQPEIASYSEAEQFYYWEALSIAFVSQQKLQEAATAQNNAIKIGDAVPTSSFIKVLNEAAGIAMVNEDWHKAESYFEHRYQLQPTLPNKTQSNFAIVKFKLAHYDEALEKINELINDSENRGESPKESWLKLAAGCYNELEDQAKMVETLEKLARYYPNNKNKQMLSRLGL
ncbi:M56 family metallopeptidase [Neptunicella sp.]|uniref:M56 family metallopeptidase n=1 Tax=Neptunicella sp. TaxID=2125986 RepID=UPI003F69492A